MKRTDLLNSLPEEIKLIIGPGLNETSIILCDWVLEQLELQADDYKEVINRMSHEYSMELERRYESC